MMKGVSCGIDLACREGRGERRAAPPPDPLTNGILRRRVDVARKRGKRGGEKGEEVIAVSVGYLAEAGKKSRRRHHEEKRGKKKEGGREVAEVSAATGSERGYPKDRISTPSVAIDVAIGRSMKRGEKEEEKKKKKEGRGALPSPPLFRLRLAALAGGHLASGLASGHWQEEEEKKKEKKRECTARPDRRISTCLIRLDDEGSCGRAGRLRRHSMPSRMGGEEEKKGRGSGEVALILYFFLSSIDSVQEPSSVPAPSLFWFRG